MFLEDIGTILPNFHFMLFDRYPGGNKNVEGDLLTFGYLMLDDALASQYRLFNVR